MYKCMHYKDIYIYIYIYTSKNCTGTSKNCTGTSKVKGTWTSMKKQKFAMNILFS